MKRVLPLRRTLETLVPPLLLFAFVAAAWQAAVVAFRIPPYLLPSPLRVFHAVSANFGKLLLATWVTGSAALAGFALSLVGGTLVGFIFSQARIIRISVYPYAVFLQTVPIIAVAPLVVVWLGAGYRSVVLIVLIISLFPIIASATAGLLAVDPDLLDFFRLNNASRWQVLWKLRLPHSVPYLIAGARTSSGLAVVGAIVGEFFAGYEMDNFGLGYLILYGSGQMRIDELFATMLACTLLGMAIFGTVSLAGAAILGRWYDAPDN